VAARGDDDRGRREDLDPDRRIGFLAQADYLSAQLAQGLVAAEKVVETKVQIFNNRLDAALTGVFMVLVLIVVLDAARVWWRTLRPGGGIAPDAIPIPIIEGPTPAPGGATLSRALRGFARGFVGAARLGGDPRTALAERAATRKSCC
jgi:hypothetical protein